MTAPTIDLVTTATEQLRREFEKADAAWDAAWSRVCELEQAHEKALAAYTAAGERRTKAESAMNQAESLRELVG